MRRPCALLAPVQRNCVAHIVLAAVLGAMDTPFDVRNAQIEELRGLINRAENDLTKC
jgi:hypothetical protein